MKFFTAKKQTWYCLDAFFSFISSYTLKRYTHNTPSSLSIITLRNFKQAGAAYLPLEASFPAPRITHILKDARPALLLVECSPKAADMGLAEGVPVLHLQDLHEEVST